MKIRNFLLNILLAVISLAVTLWVADFLLKYANTKKFESYYSARKRDESDLNEKRISFVNQKFMMSIEKNRITGKTPLILFLGDSITLGVPLEIPEHAYPDAFDTDITMAGEDAGGYIAGNISGAGANIRDEAEVFIKTLNTYELSPKVLALGYCLNDIYSYSPEERSGINELQKRLREKRRFDSDPLLYFYKQKTNLDMVRNAFSSIKDTAARHDVKALVVIFPYFVDFSEKKYRFREVHGIVRSLAEAEGLDVLDLYPFFSDYQYSDFDTDGGTHPNPLGHKFAADIIYKYVSSTGLAPLPAMEKTPGVRVESEVEKAVEFCYSIYDGERDYGISRCREILRQLIRDGKILTKESADGKSFFFLNFSIPHEKQTE